MNIGNGFLATIGNQVPVKVSFHAGKATLNIADMETEIVRHMSDNQQKGTEKVDQEDHGKSQKSQDDQDHTNEEPIVEEQPRSRKQENRQKIEGTENMVQCVGNKFMPPWKQFAGKTQ